MSPARRLKTSIELIFQEDAPHWLSSLKLTRDGDQITIQIIKANGLVYAEVDPLSLTEFNELADTLLDP